MKGKALLLVLLLLLSIAPASTVIAADDGGSRSPGVVQVKLYTQLSAQASSLSTAQSSAFLRPFVSSLEFKSVSLTRDLRVMGDLTELNQNKGFIVRLSVSAPLSATDAKVTMEVFDDTVSIAKMGNVTITRGSSKVDWRLPFLVAEDSHVFIHDHRISLRMTSDRNVHVQTDTDSYLQLMCSDHLSIDVDTRDSQDKRSSTFYPNDLQADRVIGFLGNVKDPFGGTDVRGVNVSVRKPNGDSALEPTATTVTDLNYTYTWNYPNGMPSGRYTINVTGTDLQGHSFAISSSFTMSEFGLRISSEGEESGRVTKSTTPGAAARYTLTVLNVGGKATSVQMSDGGTQVPGWTTSFSRPTFDLPAGQDDDVVFEVKPSSTLGGGNESRYIVTATAAADTGTPKASDTIEADTFVRDEAAFAILPTNPDPKTVGVGGTVDQSFTLRNTGEYPTSVDLTVTGVPTGWTAELRGTRVSNNAITDLQSMEIVDITMRVGAPANSNIKKAVISVKCQSREYPTVFAQITFTTNLVIGVALKPTGQLSFIEDPGGTFTVYFGAWNPDPQRVHNATFSIVQKNSAWDDRTSFKFTPGTVVRLSPDPRGATPTSMAIEVTIPKDAGAGAFRFTVKAMVDTLTDVYASFDFNVSITLRRELSWTMDPPDTTKNVGTDEQSIVFFVIKNDGNQDETVNVSVVPKADWVKVWINDAPGGLLSNLHVPAGQSFQVKVGLEADTGVMHDSQTTVRVSMRIADKPDLDRESDLKVVVKKTAAQVVTDFFSKVWELTVLLVVIGLVVYYANRSRSRGKDEEEEPSEKEPTHGTVVRQ